MHMEQIVWAVIAWIFLNVIVKLFVNSFERLYKAKIDEIVKKIPGTSKKVLAQFIRIILIWFFAPVFFVSIFIPSKYRHKSIFSDIYFLRKFLLERNFVERIPFLFYVLSHLAALLFADFTKYDPKRLNKK